MIGHGFRCVMSTIPHEKGFNTAWMRRNLSMWIRTASVVLSVVCIFGHGGIDAGNADAVPVWLVCGRAAVTAADRPYDPYAQNSVFLESTILAAVCDDVG